MEMTSVSSEPVVYRLQQKGETQPSLRSVQGHTGVVRTAIELHNGNIATGSEDKTVKIWQKNGPCIQTLVGHENSVWTLAEFGNDKLVSGSFDGTIKIWDNKGNNLRTLIGHTAEVFTVINLEDDAIASGSIDKTIKIWNEHGECLQTLEGHSDSVRVLIKQMNGNLVSGSYDHNIKIWNRKEGTCVQTLRGHTGVILALVELQNRNLVSGSWEDSMIKVWNPEGRCIQNIIRQEQGIIALIESKEGNIISAANDNSIHIWNRSWECIQTFQGDEYDFTHLIQTKDGNLLGCLFDKKGSFTIMSFQEKKPLSSSPYKNEEIVPISKQEKLEVREKQSSENKREEREPQRNWLDYPDIKTLDNHSVKIHIALKNGIFVGISGKTIKLLDRTGKCIQTLTGHTDEVQHLLVLKDGMLASCAADNAIKIWDPKTGECIKTIKGSFLKIKALVELKNGTIAAGCYNGIVKIWNRDGNCLQTLQTNVKVNNRLHLLELRDGTLAVCPQDCTLRLWDLKNNSVQILQHTSDHDSRYSETTVEVIELRDEILVSLSKTINLWDRKGVCYKIIHPEKEVFFEIKALKDGTFACISYGKIKIFDQKGDCIQTLIGGISNIFSRLFSRSSNLILELDDGILATAAFKTILIWDLKHNVIQELHGGHSEAIDHPLLSIDGDLISSSDHTTIIRTFPEKQPDLPVVRPVIKNEELVPKRNWKAIPSVKKLIEHKNRINIIYVLKDEMLASGSDDKTVKIWNLDGNCIKTLSGFFQGHSDSILCLTEFSDGIIATGSKDKTFKLWDVKGNCIRTFKGHKSEVTKIFELKDGTIVSSSYDEAKLWTRNGKCIKTSENDFMRELPLKFHKLNADIGILTSWRTEDVIIELKNGMFVGSAKSVITLWNKEFHLKTLQGHSKQVSCLLELTDERVASGSDDGTIILWNYRNNHCQNLKGHTDRITKLLELKNGMLVSSSKDNTIKFWDGDGNCIHTLLGHTGGVNCLIELTDGVVVSGSEDHTIKFWDYKGNCLNTLNEHFSSITDLLELKNGTLVSVSFSFIMWWTFPLKD